MYNDFRVDVKRWYIDDEESDFLKNGLTPLDRYGNPFHLHHPYGREGDNYFIFGPVDPTTHMNIHSK